MTIELSKWQGEDGFPTDAYLIAVVEALKAAGVAIETWWRDEPWDAVIELHESAFNPASFPKGTAGLAIGWRVDEESDPLRLSEDESWHGFQPVGGITGWWWMPTRSTGEGIRVEPLAEALDEPEDVAAAVKEIVSPA